MVRRGSTARYLTEGTARRTRRGSSPDELGRVTSVFDGRLSSDSDAAAESKVFPAIEHRYEPAPDLVDRLRFIDALLSSPSSPLE
jgi:hypothetical protein